MPYRSGLYFDWNFNDIHTIRKIFKIKHSLHQRKINSQEKLPYNVTTRFLLRLGIFKFFPSLYSVIPDHDILLYAFVSSYWTVLFTRLFADFHYQYWDIKISRNIPFVFSSMEGVFSHSWIVGIFKDGKWNNVKWKKFGSVNQKAFSTELNWILFKKAEIR